MCTAELLQDAADTRVQLHYAVSDDGDMLCDVMSLNSLFELLVSRQVTVSNRVVNSIC